VIGAEFFRRCHDGRKKVVYKRENIVNALRVKSLEAIFKEPNILEGAELSINEGAIVGTCCL